MSFLTTRGISKEEQIRNLSELKLKKQKRHTLLLRQARKTGQIRAYRQHVRLLSLEIEKEERELEIIDEELRTLKQEINALN